ncbi:cytochrome b/b6 domain-containing protein [Fischerella thermalis]|jgi:thiosulfate reductase cytochrome b subunit|uniref:Thiosulfate reductase cytochrome B subunit (Membrane anchoring protein) n=1 Tax=Fischerella thermalis CCMEE 5268 TaxID=2019662 RepID=A0A2N6KJ15_9CYAN|nr:cytochrome b/b6 domain-containing protein [Fischerella thermalis]PLZ84220.1 thiosulfate reductase cytochrome B subunit (membrane anchoring protein) [Fischerella thermalis WC217]PLZ97002.1 thiosulfate reductase cytochrome B subunit (membrane anchoring protein) [Fischerella thermalis CCMEE 5328]PMB10912.1 thiosulfate reductase cytochrome B subunit (membrane anchoring protein) [Fischerella thermalis CCMEE 5273]RDH51932.1 thiosulfate reductase cytochrome B subunit (membrane anchoring protein) [M
MTLSVTPKHRKLPTQATGAKIFHWVNIISLFIMLTSGLQIYNANPVFGGRSGLHIPPIFTLGGWLAGGRHWHFAAMWLFSINLLWYGFYVFITRRWRHRFVGANDIKALQKTQNPKRLIYAWHRIVYTSIIPILLLAIFTGIGMYKPAQFPWIVDLFGSWQGLRIMHFSSVPLVIIFVIVHGWLGKKAGGSELTDSMFW